jgi:hypothetical protein
MARPKTDEGFIMIALDLYAAIAASDLPNRCQVVLAEALLELYGPHKAQTVNLVPATLEQFTGLHRNNARRAIGELVTWGILTQNDDGSYSFNKDYESWRVKGEPLSGRLGGGLQKFAMSALSRHGKRATHKRETQSRRIQVSALTSIPLDSGIPTYLNPVGLPENVPPLQPPIEETHARLDLRIKNKDTQTESDDSFPSKIAKAFNKVDHRGDADPAFAIPIGQWIANKPESWVWEQVGKSQDKGNPFAYFRRLMEQVPTEAQVVAASRSQSGKPLPFTSAELEEAKKKYGF